MDALAPVTIGINTSFNATNFTTLEILPTFNEDSLICVIAYSILFGFSAAGNLSVFMTLFKNRERASRVQVFVMHLNIADLIVTFVMLPIEIGWFITVQWKAGDIGCRVLMVFRAFGFYLSSSILIVISVDRYLAFTHPLAVSLSRRRGKIMLIVAWLFSVAASLPQGVSYGCYYWVNLPRIENLLKDAVIFHVEAHPHHPWFLQCVTFNFFPTPAHELAYNLFTILAVYGFPLLVIIVCYSLILRQISIREKCPMEATCHYTVGDESYSSESTRSTRSSLIRYRTYEVRQLSHARQRTLKMTLVIVFVFILCWTPYFVISTWWWFDKHSANLINPKVQKGLFMFAVSNSCMDPIIYGMFTTLFRRTIRRKLEWFRSKIRIIFRRKRNLRQTDLNRIQKYI